MLNGVAFDNIEMDQDRVSKIIRIRYSDIERLCFHNIISGTPDGSILLQISNDPTEDEALVTNWVDYTGSLVSILGVSQLMINVKDMSFRWARLAYIRVADTGYITSNFTVVKRYE